MSAPKKQTRMMDVDMTGLDGTVGFLLKRAQLAVAREINGMFAEFDITAVQFSVLTVVERNPGIGQGELALALEVERPRMVPVLDKLEGRGLAVRRPDPHDARSRRIYLTESGSAVRRELQARFAKLERWVADLLGEADRDHLLAALRRLADHRR